MNDAVLARALAAVAGAAGAAVLGALAWRASRGAEGEPAIPVPVPELPRGASAGSSGISPLDDREVEALARVVASEAGGRGSESEKQAIAWTVRNRFRGKSIYDVEHPWRAQRGKDPPFASSKDATDETRALARAVLAADQSQDPTGGATAFFEPRLQDALAKAGALARAGETGSRVINGIQLSDITRFKSYHKDADRVRRDWGKGSALYATAGRFEFWGSAKLLAGRGGPRGEIAVAGDLEALGARRR